MGTQKMRWLTFLVAASVVISLLVAVGCAGPTAPEEKPTVKIAVVTALTGWYQETGFDARSGALLAMKEITEAGSSASPQAISSQGENGNHWLYRGLQRSLG